MPSKQARIDAWLHEHSISFVELSHFQQLQALLTPVSESSLRHLLRAGSVPLHPLVAGVNQDSLRTLCDSLLALAAHYEQGDAQTRRLIRSIVITARDHAKLAARNQKVAPEKRKTKEEMAEWLRTWLENPLIFPLWAQLRAKLLELD